MSTAIRSWLQEIELPQYISVFEENAIDIDLLPQVDDQLLKDMGINIAGHRLRLRAAIQKLTHPPQAEPAQSSTTHGASESVAASSGNAERRQLTILFCDLVGSTKLSQEMDPERLRDVMQAYQQVCQSVIARYAGHVAQYLGDGLMVYFGWPRAHEDDAERAVRSALELITATKQVSGTTPLQVRIGIATGPVVVGDTGAGDASVPKLAVGETPNLAARLQGLAGPDEIIVAAATRRLIGQRFEYVDLSEQSVKGIVQPVSLSRVTGIREGQGRFEARTSGRLTPMVGREEQIDIVQRRWASARAGEGQVVLLTGEPGIGKSRVSMALRDSVQTQGHFLLHCQCSSLRVNSALHPIVQLLQQVADLTLEDTNAQKLDKIEALIREAGREVTRAASALVNALSLSDEGRYPTSNVSPQRQRDEVVSLLADLIIRKSQSNPLLISFEDAHWIDPSSADVLDLIVAGIQAQPVLLIITYRPEYTPRWTGASNVTLVSLNRLTRKQVVEVVNGVTGGRTLPAPVLDEIAKRTDGVPLFVEELTKAVLESGLLQWQGERYELTAPLTTLAIPVTLHDSLMARLDHLSKVKDTAQLASCIGREFSYELIAAVAPMPVRELEQALHLLVQADLLLQRGSGTQAIYLFKHALIQDAAYASLLKTRREVLHKAIADALSTRFPEGANSEPEVLARHYSDARMSEQAADYWEKAAQRALNKFANAEVISHFNATLAALSKLPETRARDVRELAIQTSLGNVLSEIEGFSSKAARDAFLKARQLCAKSGMSDADIRAISGLWVYYLVCAEYPACADLISEIKPLVDAQQDPIDARYHLSCASLDFYFHGAFSRAKEHSELARRINERVKDQEVFSSVEWSHRMFAAFDYSSWAGWLTGYPDTSDALREEAIARSRETGIPFVTASLLAHSALYDYCREAPDIALARAREVLALSAEYGYPFRTAEGLMIEGWALSELGEFAAGIAKIEEGFALCNRIGSRIANSLFLSLFVHAHLKAGQPEVAREYLDRAIAFVRETGEGLWKVELHRLDGELTLQRTRALDQAQECFEHAMELARSQCAKMLELRAACSMARLWQSQGKHAEARALLNPLYQWFTEGYESWDLQQARALLSAIKTSSDTN